MRTFTRHIIEVIHHVYSEVITKEELNQIGVFVSGTLADVEVKQFPPKTRLHVQRSFPEFMDKIFWPAVRKGWTIVGFNLAFDLSRLTRGWRRSRKRGFLCDSWKDSQNARLRTERGCTENRFGYFGTGEQ